MVQIGDVLVEVDGISVLKLSVKEISGLMLGPEGSKGEFGFLRGGEKFVISIIRRPIPNSSSPR